MKSSLFFQVLGLACQAPASAYDIHQPLDVRLSTPAPGSELIGKEFLVPPPDASDWLHKMPFTYIRRYGQGRDYVATSVPKSELAGKVLKALDVYAQDADTVALLTTAGSDLRYQVKLQDGGIPEIVERGAFEGVVKALKGQTRWYSQNMYDTLDPVTGARRWEHTRKYARVRITDVTLGTQALTPMRVHFRTWDDKPGFWDVRDLRAANLFFTTIDARSGSKWPARVWQAIDEGEVLIGMNEAQVHMAIGTPDEVHRTTTANGVNKQLVYKIGPSRKYVYLEGDHVTTIQD